MISHPRWFLLPRLWHNYESILRQYVTQNEPQLEGCLERISKRNLRLLTTISQPPGWRPPNTARQRLINILDTVQTNVHFSNVTEDCLQTVDDFDVLVATCLEWASSRNRDGDDRVYICTRLLRQCSKVRAELDTSIMRFIATTANFADLSIEKLYRLLAELLRSKHIAPGRYLSWLMARGNPGGHPTSAQVVQGLKLYHLTATLTSSGMPFL